MRTAKLHLSQFIETSRSYQNTATLLQFFDPSNIILPANCIIRQGMIELPSKLIVNQFASATTVEFLHSTNLQLNNTGPNWHSQCHFDSIFWISYMPNYSAFTLWSTKVKLSLKSSIIPTLQVTLARGCFDDTKVRTVRESWQLFEVMRTDPNYIYPGVSNKNPGT